MKPLLEMNKDEIKKVIKRLKKSLESDVGELAACDYAGITREEYDLIASKHPDIKVLAQRAGSVLGVKASINIAEAINDKDVKVSQWYKEHTDPKYSKKMQVEGSVTLSADEREEKIDEIFDKL